MVPINQISNTNLPGKFTHTGNNAQKLQTNFNDILDNKNISKVISNNLNSKETQQIAKKDSGNLQNTDLHLGNLLDRLKTLQTNIDSLINKGEIKRTIKTSEMITLQKALLNYSQEIQVLSKVLEQLVNGIKTLIQMQV